MMLQGAGRLIFDLRRSVVSLLSSSLLDDVQRQYGLGRGFTHEYLKNSFGEGYDDKYRNLVDLFKQIDAIRKIHVDFALTSNARGKAAVRQLKPYINKSHRKYLDVGSAYGGFVVAFANAGFDAFGLEIDAGLARYGMLNCADFNLHDRITVGSILDVHDDQAGVYDLITCNDVIEHVSDAAKTLDILSRMLRVGGILNMMIPNRDAISFVESDGHFLLFGITLLEREYAKQYKFEMTGVEDSFEHMGEYFPLDFYRQRLLLNDLQIVRCQNSDSETPGISDIPPLLSRLSSAYQRWCENDQKRLSFEIGQMVNDKYLAYCEQLHSDLNVAKQCGDHSLFSSKYLTAFWNIVAIKCTVDTSGEQDCRGNS